MSGNQAVKDGRVPDGTRLSSSTEPLTGLRPAGFDPSRGMRVAGHFFDARALRPAVEAMCPGKGIDYFETCDIARPLLSACRRRGLNATYVAGRLLQWARIEGFVRHRGRGQWVRCDSDGSPKGGDACGSVHDSAGRETASPDLGSPTTIVRGE